MFNDNIHTSMKVRLSRSPHFTECTKCHQHYSRLNVHYTVPSCPHLILLVRVCPSSQEELHHFVVAVEAGNY